MATNRKYKHTLVSETPSYKFSCDDEKTFTVIREILRGLSQPRPVPAVSNAAQPHFAEVAKSPDAQLWRCVAIPNSQMKIHAIRIFREITKYSLASSKHWVEGTQALYLEAHEAGDLWSHNFVLVLV